MILTTFFPAVVAVVFLWPFPALFWLGGVEKKPPVKVDLTILPAKEKYYVGEPIRVGMRVENLLGEDIYLPPWTKSNRESAWKCYGEIEDYPGAISGLMSLLVEGCFCGYGIGVEPLEKKEKVPPQRKSTPVWETFIPQIPGKLSICVELRGDAIGVKIEPRFGQEESFPYCSEYFFNDRTLTIEPTMSPEMAKQYSASAKMILSGETPLADRLAELDKVANQRHYFAARFVHDIWQKGEPGPVKEAALNHLVSLLEYGTAYESLPDLLKVLKDSQTPLPIRLRILNFIGKMGLMEDAPGFPIAEGQAFYCLTKSKVVGKEVQCEKTELWREIVETLKSVSKDSHVLLREKATAILAGKDPETPPEKPEVQTEPQKPSAPEPDGPTSEKEALFVLRSGWSASHLMDDMANVFHQKYFPDKPQIDVSVNDGVIVACKMHEDYGAVGDLAVVRNLSAPEAAKDVGPGVDGVPLAKFVVVVIVNAKNPLRHLT